MAEEKKFEKVDDATLLSYIQQEMYNSNDSSFSIISRQRIESNKAFANLHTLRTEPSTGLSSINHFYTTSCVNTLVTHLSKVFCSDQKLVDYSPLKQDEESVAAADQLAELVDSVIFRENRGFENIYTCLQSAAINKMGIIKVTWDEEFESWEETFPMMKDEAGVGLKMRELQDLGFDVEVTSEPKTKTVKKIVVDEYGNEVEVEDKESTGEYALRLTRNISKINVTNVPPEEFRINLDTTRIQSNLTRFVAHTKEMYKTDIRMMWPDVDVDKLAAYSEIDQYYEKYSRGLVDGTGTRYNTAATGHNDMNKIYISECWIRADRDGDGYAEWRRVFTAGNEILSDEEWFGPLPMTHFTFFPIAHKFYGMSVYDLTHYYDEAATGLLRGNLNTLNLKNTPRWIMRDNSSFDVENFASGRPGPILAGGSFKPEDMWTVPAPQSVDNIQLQLDELLSQVSANIGINPRTMQVSTDIEKSGNDSEKTQMSIDSASAKIEGYARYFAEVTLRDMIWLIAIELVKRSDEPFVQNLVKTSKHGPKFLADMFGLHNVVSKNGITMKAGLGNQTNHQKVQSASVLATLLQQLSQDPTEANYNLTVEAARGLGNNNPEALVGPYEVWAQKAAEFKQMQQQQQQVAERTIMLQEEQFKHEQQKYINDLELRKMEVEGKMERESNESSAKIEEMISKAELNQAKVFEVEADTAAKEKAEVVASTQWHLS